MYLPPTKCTFSTIFSEHIGSAYWPLVVQSTFSHAGVSREASKSLIVGSYLKISHVPQENPSLLLMLFTILQEGLPFSRWKHFFGSLYYISNLQFNNMQLQILEACCLHSVHKLEFQSWWIYSWSVQLWIGSSKCYSYTFHANCKCHMWYFNGWYNIFPLEKVLIIALSTGQHFVNRLVLMNTIKQSHDPSKMNIGNSLATIMASGREGKYYALKSNLLMNFSIALENWQVSSLIFSDVLPS